MKLIRLVLVSVIALIALFIVLSLLDPLPPAKPYSTVVKDRDGNFLHAFLASDERWRLETNPEEIPLKLKAILLHKEDRYFYYHPGVNPVSIARALGQNLIAGRRISGASTITMQVARMMEPKERTYWNKLYELFRAFQLELRYSKEEILELYLSMVPLGGNVEGLESAALLYYQTPLERLNIAHLIDLILIPNDPNRLRPDRNPDALFAERTRRAQEWIDSGILNSEDSLVIWQTPAQWERIQPPQRAPHFSLRMSRQVGQGGRVRTTIDLEVQRTAERLLYNHLRTWKLRGVRNGSVVVVDNKSREVLAYVGSPDFDDSLSAGQVDAVRAVRSPGSALKPFLYALRMDRGVLTPKRILLDTPYDAEGFYAENYDGTYSGLVTAEAALRRSLNVPLIRMLQETGMPVFVNHLNDAGFHSLESQKANLGLSMIVGGCGVTLEELTTAFLIFPNGGSLAPLKMTLEGDSDAAWTRTVYSPGTSYLITEILSGLDRPDLPNNFESSRNLPKVAFKTGTSYGRRDAWSIGYSAELTIGVWVGNADNQGSPELVGSKAAAPLLIDLFNALSSPHLKSILPMPREVSLHEVCARSGLLPTSRCTQRVFDYYSVQRTLAVSCEMEKEFQVSPDRRRHYCPSCVGHRRTQTVVFVDYPPELLSFWETVGRVVERAPQHNAECTRLFSGTGPKILSPTDGMTYFQTSDRQKLTLSASSGVDVTEHGWYFGDRFLGRIRAGEKLFFPMKPGEHTITCTDNKGRKTSVTVIIQKVS